MVVRRMEDMTMMISIFVLMMVFSLAASRAEDLQFEAVTSVCRDETCKDVRVGRFESMHQCGFAAMFASAEWIRQNEGWRIRRIRCQPAMEKA